MDREVATPIPPAGSSERELLGADWAIAPPSRLALFGEARVVVEWTMMRVTLPLLRRAAPRGDGGPVVVVPGFAVDDAATASLRGFLGAISYDVRGWGLGRNHGRLSQHIPELIAVAERVASETGRSLRLVGWSLGGNLVREVARERPELVETVVTLGAPVVGGPKFTAFTSMYRRRGFDLEAVEASAAAREALPIRVPIHAIFSSSDGIVAWRACIDRRNVAVRHHELRTSHVGLVASPTAFRLVAEVLAEAP